MCLLLDRFAEVVRHVVDVALNLGEGGDGFFSHFRESTQTLCDRFDLVVQGAIGLLHGVQVRGDIRRCGLDTAKRLARRLNTGDGIIERRLQLFHLSTVFVLPFDQPANGFVELLEVVTELFAQLLVELPDDRLELLDNGL